jgi:hypothetical protein
MYRAAARVAARLLLYVDDGGAGSLRRQVVWAEGAIEKGAALLLHARICVGKDGAIWVNKMA